MILCLLFIVFIAGSRQGLINENKMVTAAAAPSYFLYSAIPIGGKASKNGVFASAELRRGLHDPVCGQDANG
jgi:hypothetical protein